MPKELIRKAIRSLNDSLFQIITLHYGLDGTSRLSFEEMSPQLGLPTETLADYERKAIRQLRRPSTAKLMVHAIEKADQNIWRFLSNDHNVVYKQTLAQLKTQVPGEYLIGIRCIYNSVFNWVNHNAWQNNIAWFRSEFSKEILLQTSGRLKRLHKRIPLPITFQRAARVLNIEERLVRQATALSMNRLSTFNGYIAPRPVGARKLRALRLHTIFREMHHDGVLTVHELLAQYLQRYSDDDAITRDMMLAMVDNPHMFINLGHMGWYPILQEDEQTFEPEEKSVEEMATCFYKRAKDGTSNLEAIKKIVRSRGSCRPMEVADELEEKTGVRLSNLNLPQLFAQSFDFVQVSPSVYALGETLNDLDAATSDSDALLTKSDIRWYSMARYAGEPMNTFPFWTSAMEWKWCQWAEKNAINPEKMRLYRSFLYIADPRSWSTTDEEKAYWRRIKQWTGHYFLKYESKHPLWKIKPPLMDLFALTICTCETGSMNWIRANRSIGNYAFDQHSIIHLSLLIGLGIVLQTDHWQKPHEIGPNAGMIKNQIMESARQYKPISWNSDFGSDLRKRLHQAPAKLDMGWVTPSEFSKLIKKLDGESIEDDFILHKDDNKQRDPVSKQPPKQLKLF